MIEVVSEADLNAYVDDQLDAKRRMAVEDYLAGNPPLAARIMADLRSRDALRLALRAPMRAAEGPTLEAAGRLRKTMVWRRMSDKFRKAAAVVFFIGIGWLAHEETGLLRIGGTEAAGVTPPFVADALMAHRTELMRTHMDSQSRPQGYDPAEIKARMDIVMPEMPDDWTVTDVQVFPSRKGGSVELSVAAGTLGHVSIYAVPTQADLLQPPAMAVSGDETTVYWQTGRQAFALTGNGGVSALRRTGWLLFGNSVNPRH
jgi:anti-sigma factor RsiW